MDGFDDSQAPPEYHAVKPIVNLFVLGMGVGWLVNYIGMIYTSFHNQTYGMAIMPLCCNIAWEVVYGVIYPSKHIWEQGVIFSGLVFNLAVVYTAIRFGPNEWTHAPLVKENLGVIFAIGILAFLTGHLALVAEIGHSLAYSWGAAICQLMLSVGCLCQLLCRYSTRGASYTLWLSRFLGSACTVGFAFLRWKYWPECFTWLSGPLVLWSLVVFFVIDGSYGVCYWYVKRFEQSVREKKQI